MNAGNLAYDLTRVNREKLAQDGAAGKLGAFSSVLAFQSAIDATVSAPALVRDLFDKLPEHGHELVVFDLNRNSAIEPLLKKDPRSEEVMIREKAGRTFTFSLLTNASPATQCAVVRSWGWPRKSQQRSILAWPGRVLFILSRTFPCLFP